MGVRCLLGLRTTEQESSINRLTYPGLIPPEVEPHVIGKERSTFLVLCLLNFLLAASNPPSIDESRRTRDIAYSKMGLSSGAYFFLNIPQTHHTRNLPSLISR